MDRTSDDIVFMFALNRLCDSIATFVRRQDRRFCADCVAELKGDEYGADGIHVRLAMVRLALSGALTSGGSCALCDASHRHDNPVLGPALTFAEGFPRLRHTSGRALPRDLHG